jgi:hypothetical protein
MLISYLERLKAAPQGNRNGLHPETMSSITQPWEVQGISSYFLYHRALSQHASP